MLCSVGLRSMMLGAETNGCAAWFSGRGWSFPISVEVLVVVVDVFRRSLRCLRASRIFENSGGFVHFKHKQMRSKVSPKIVLVSRWRHEGSCTRSAARMSSNVNAVPCCSEWMSRNGLWCRRAYSEKLTLERTQRNSSRFPPRMAKDSLSTGFSSNRNKRCCAPNSCRGYGRGLLVR